MCARRRCARPHRSSSRKPGGVDQSGSARPRDSRWRARSRASCLRPASRSPPRRPRRRLSRLDLPTFGRPMSTTRGPRAARRPAAPPRSSRRSARRNAAELRAASAASAGSISSSGKSMHASTCMRSSMSAVDQRVDAPRELAGERTQRALRAASALEASMRSATPLGLREVEAIVEERAARELAGLGDARAQLDAAAQQLAHHDRAAVALQLEHVLAGIRMRRAESRARCPRRCSSPSAARKCASVACRGAGSAPRIARDAIAARRARDAHDSDAAAPGRRRDRGDRVAAGALSAGLSPWLRASSVRLMCHCCSDRQQVLHEPVEHQARPGRRRRTR